MSELTIDRGEISAAGGGVQRLFLRGVEGAEYHVVGSMTGIGHYQLPNGDVLPLVPDSYFYSTFFDPNPWMRNFTGVFDSTDMVEAVLTVPPGSLSPGTNLWHAFWVENPAPPPCFVGRRGFVMCGETLAANASGPVRTTVR